MPSLPDFGAEFRRERSEAGAVMPLFRAGRGLTQGSFRRSPRLPAEPAQRASRAHCPPAAIRPHAAARWRRQAIAQGQGQVWRGWHRAAQTARRRPRACLPESPPRDRHGNADLTTGFLCPDRKRATAFGLHAIFQRIIDEVGDGLPDELAIGIGHEIGADLCLKASPASSAKGS